MTAPYDLVVLNIPNLVAYYRLGEPSGTVAHDISPIANNGIYYNTPALGIAGPLVNDSDTAAGFASASSEYMEATSNAAYNFGTGNYSLSFLFKRSGNPTAPEFILYRGDGSNGWGAYMDTAGQLRTPIGALIVTSASGLADGAWHHALLVMDRGGNGVWYIDGAISGSPVNISSESTRNLTNTSVLDVAQCWTTGNYFNGSLDEIAVWATWLKATQRAALWASASLGPSPLTLWVGGLDITGLTDLSSYVVVESGCRQPGQLNCTVLDSTISLGLAPKALTQLWDNNDGRFVFTGYLNPAQLDTLGNGRSFQLTCDDLGEILDLSLVPSESRPAETLYARMVYLLSTYGPLMPQIWTYIVNPGPSLPACLLENTTLRGAIEMTCSLAGTGWYYWSDGAGLLHVTNSTADTAPFALDTRTPAGGEVNPEEPFTITRDSKSLVNAYYMRGANAAGSGWVTNSGSITAYGRREAYYDAPNATTWAMAQAVGNALLDTNAWPSLQGQVHITGANGWKPGQILDIRYAAHFDIWTDTYFRINLVTRYYFAGGNTKAYDIQFGGLIPLWAYSAPPPRSVVGKKIGTGTVGIEPFAPWVRPVVIVSALPGLPDTNYPADSYAILTTDHKLYQNLSGSWVNAINQSLPVGFSGIPPVGSLPGLPNAAYPIGFVVFLTTDGKLYRNVANVWVKATDGADITAGTITGDRMVAGTITASQIAANTITAAQIAAGAIGATQLSVGINRNTCPNGSFENYVGSIGADLSTNALLAAAVPGWELVVHPAGSTIRVWQGSPYQGANCMQLIQGSTPAAMSVYSALVPVSPGEIYGVRAWVRGYYLNTSPAYASLYIQWYKADGSASATANTAVFTNYNVGASATWIEETGRVAAPSDAAFARVRPYSPATSTATAQVAFDAIEFYPAAYDAAGHVTIDSTGVAITNGELTVTNAGSTVIIDGTSDIFKIVATGTITVPANGTAPVQNTNTVNLSTGLTYVPASLWFQQQSGYSATMPFLNFNNANGAALQYNSSECWMPSSGHTGMWASALTISGTVVAWTFRYYALVETGY
jgi:hypothetical protein